MTPRPHYRSKRDAIRALVRVFGEDPDRDDEIAKGFELLVALGLVERGDMADSGYQTARTMLWHRRSGRHGWPETAGTTGAP